MVRDLSEAFPRKVRIVRSSDYQCIYKTGKKIYSESFVLFWRENQVGHHRLGITASRKVGTAVVRNRIKRLIREIFRTTYREMPGQFDIVVNIRPDYPEASFSELKAEFLRAADRIMKST